MESYFAMLPGVFRNNLVRCDDGREKFQEFLFRGSYAMVFRGYKESVTENAIHAFQLQITYVKNYVIPTDSNSLETFLSVPLNVYFCSVDFET